MSIKPTTKTVKKTRSTKKTVKAAGAGKNNPTSEIEKDIARVKYQDINDAQDAGSGARICQTIDESDNVGKDIDYK